MDRALAAQQKAAQSARPFLMRSPLNAKNLVAI